MGTFSVWHWLIVLAIVVLLFGRGKISDLMGDVAKGIKSFKKGLADDDSADGSERQRAATLDTPAGKPAEKSEGSVSKVN